MEDRQEKLQLFFDRIKTLSFWQRVFGWKSLRELSYEAYEEFKSLLSLTNRLTVVSNQSANSISKLNDDNERLKSEIQTFEADKRSIKDAFETASRKVTELTASIASKDETIRQTQAKIHEQDKDLSKFEQKNDDLTNRQLVLEQENAILSGNEKSRINDHDKKMTLLTGEIDRIRNERTNETEKAHNEAVEKIENMKQIWGKHEDETKNAIKAICQKHTIEYVEKVPFKGSPDNTLKICDEYVIFDAKSPLSDDLQNFPSYIKIQTASVKKYVNQENVRKDIFLVIPSNTVEVIQQFSYNMADYTVYVVTLDVLEPLILSLKKIEEYEFLNQLSPEERENICRIVGKFAHITKRKIQIDNFFTYEFLSVLSKCKTDLPREILEKVIEFEKAEKLNPPQEKRSKQILTDDLLSDSEKIRREAEAKGIIFPLSLQEDLKSLPLYEGE